MTDPGDRLAICHYSFHRTWSDQGWDIARLTEEVAAQGVGAVDYHARLLGETEGAAEKISAALERTGLKLSGFSLSTNFNLADAGQFEQHLTDTIAWLEVAAALDAPVCRVFGGTVDRSDPSAIEAGLERVVTALKRLAPLAQTSNLVLALENHGGLPCTGDEQVSVIDAIGSPAVRATVDIGNYMACGQEGTEGTAIAASRAAYVHVKDIKRDPQTGKNVACVLGQGDVDIPACVRTLKEAGYDGYYALEYEAPDDEIEGVASSIEYMKKVLGAL